MQSAKSDVKDMWLMKSEVYVASRRRSADVEFDIVTVRSVRPTDWTRA
jgi:hypothetical protein